MTMADHLLVLYASQTGNSEWIAKNIDEQARSRGYATQCMNMDTACEQMADSLHAEPLLIFVASTTGDGDAPDNALKFWRWIRRAAKLDGAFKQTRFTVLGLGDTNYSNFGAHPRRIEKKLMEIGATTFYPKAIADEVETIEATVDPWIAGLWPALEKVCTPKNPVAVKDSVIPSGADHVLLEQPNTEMKISDAEAAMEKLKIKEELSGQLKGHQIPLPWTTLNDIGDISGLPRIPPAPSMVNFVTPSEGNHVGLTPEEWYVGQKDSVNESQEDGGEITERWNQHRPFFAQLSAVSCLTTKDAMKRTLFMEMDIEGMKWDYVPGDALGMLCPNEDDMVRAVAQKLNLDLNQLIELKPAEGHTEDQLPSHVRRRLTVHQYFKYCADIRGPPRKAFYRMCAEYCQDVNEKKMLLYLCSKQGAPELKKYSEFSPTLLDFLCTFPSCRPPLARLIDILAPIAPRYYSICTSPLAHPTKIRFAFNVVQYVTPEPLLAERHGLCTPWLDTLSGRAVQPEQHPTSTQPSEWHAIPSPQPRVPIFPRPSKDFVLPENSNGGSGNGDETKDPVIMIGPGTGVAPFLGFLEHRAAQITSGVPVGEMWLFFGCRHRGRDFLLEHELETYKSTGVLSELKVCFSREAKEGEPRYVQDNLIRYGKEIADLMMKKNGRIYVCGDARGMAKDVHAALISIVQSHVERMNETMAATKQVMSWMEDKRYLRDIWA